jgi:hypothetical protein
MVVMIPYYNNQVGETPTYVTDVPWRFIISTMFVRFYNSMILVTIELKPRGQLNTSTRQFRIFNQDAHVIGMDKRQ